MSFDKRIETGDFDFGLPAAQLLPVHSRGPDRDWLIKNASDLSRQFEGIRPQKGRAHLLLISLGAVERYGGNRNGDAFNAKSGSLRIPHPGKGCPAVYEMGGGLETHHPTFVKYAKVYAHHRNKEHDPSIGSVDAEHFNRRMARGELIISVPEDHEEWRDELQKAAAGRPIPFSMSIRVPFDVCFPAGTPIRTEDGCVPIQDVRVGVQVVTHKGRLRPVTAVLRRPYEGRYATLKVEGIPEPLTATGNHPFWVVRAEKLHACQGTANGRRRRHAPKDGSDACGVCGRTAVTEPEWADAESLRVGDYLVRPVPACGEEPADPDLAYLTGLYIGNGYCRKEGRGCGKTGPKRAMGVTVTCNAADGGIIERAKSAFDRAARNPAIVRPYTDGRSAVNVTVYDQDLAAAVIRLGGQGSATKRLSPEVFRWNRDARLRLLAGLIDSDGSADGGTGSCRITTVSRRLAGDVQELAWSLGIPAGLASQAVCGGCPPDSLVCYFVRIGGVFLAPLRELSVRASRPSLPDRTRNCVLLAGGYAYLRIKETSGFEGSGEVFNFSVEEDESYVAGGVVVHNCMICGHKARTRDEYCSHARDHLGAITKEGYQVNVLNDRGVFFDISKVVRPADRIAYSMRMAKAAAAGNAGRAPAIAPLTPDVRKLAAAGKLAAMEKEIEARGEAVASGAGLPEAGLTDEETRELRRRPLREVTAALAEAKVLLPLRDFLKLVTGSDSRTDETASLLPRLYSSMGGDEISDCCCGRDYDPDPFGPPPDLLRMIGPIAERMSLAEGPVRRRTMVAIVGRPGRTPPRTKQASHDPEAVLLAREYARYQISFAAAVDDPLTRFMAVVLNRVSH